MYILTLKSDLVTLKLSLTGEEQKHIHVNDKLCSPARTCVNASQYEGHFYSDPGYNNFNYCIDNVGWRYAVS